MTCTLIGNIINTNKWIEFTTDMIVSDVWVSSQIGNTLTIKYKGEELQLNSNTTVPSFMFEGAVYAIDTKVDLKINPPRLPLQKNALRVEAITPAVKCFGKPDADMAELIKSRFAAVVSNPGIHYQNFGYCTHVGKCGTCPVFLDRQ